MTGGAGRVHQGEIRIRVDIHRWPAGVIGLRQQSVQRHAVGHVAHANGRDPQLFCEGSDPFSARTIGEYQLGATVFEPVGQLICRPPGVHQHSDSANVHDAHEEA